ncbi:MAG: ABC transporter substrate-binding protein, partial [Nitrospirota bacterium]
MKHVLMMAGRHQELPRGNASFPNSWQRWVFVVSVALLSILLGIVLANARENDTAKERVRNTVDSVMGILLDKQLQAPGQAHERGELVKQAVSRLVNYEEMGKRTLGAQWHKLTVNQQREFVGLFQQFLSISYESRFKDYSEEEVQYLGEWEKGDFAEVRTVLVSKKVNVPLDFRLLRKSGEWWVYDLV